MGISFNRPFDLLDQTLSLMSGERLAFNSATNAVLIVRRRAKLPVECSLSLSGVARRIQELVSQRNLKPEQILNLKLNISAVNTLYTRYNAAIAQCVFFNFLDKLLLILTLGFFQLKYSRFEAPQVDEKSKELLKIDSLDTQMVSRLIRYLAADPQRVHKLPTLATMLLSLSQPLNNYEMASLIFIATEYAKFLKSNPKHIQTTPQKVFEKLFHYSNHPQYASKLASVPQLVDQELGNFSFQPEFRFMGSNGKEMLINLSEIVRKRSPERLFEVFKTPASLIHAIEQISALPNKSDLLQDLLNHAFTKMEIFCSSQMPRFVELVHMLMKKQRGLKIDLRGLTSQQRLPLLSYLSKEAKLRTSPLSREICSACLANYSTLSADEKPHFFVLQHFLDSSFKSLAQFNSLLIDLIRDVLAFGNPHKYELKVINSYINYSKLTESETETYLKFLGNFDFIASLGHPQVEHHISFIKGNSKRIAGLTNAAFDLCKQFKATSSQVNPAIESIIEGIYECLDINLLIPSRLAEFVCLSWFKQSTEKHLLKVDFGKIGDGKFKILSELPEFAAKADIYLANASDTHWTMYYEPMERSLLVNNAHLFKPCSFQEKEIPPIPAGVKAPSLDQLLTLFDQINFTNKNSSDYYNPRLLDEYKKEVTPEYIRDGLKKLIQYINSRKFYTSAPAEKLRCGSPNPAFPKFFDMMLLCVQHIVLALSKKSPSERAAVLEILGLGGHKCAMRHKVESRQMYTYLTGEALDIDVNAPAKDILYSVLAKFRLEVLVELAQITNSDVHFVNATKKHVGPKLGINAESSPGDEDGYEPTEWLPLNRTKTIHQFLMSFHKKYLPTAILNAVSRFINDPSRTAKSDFREKFMDALDFKLKANGKTLSDCIIYGHPDYPGFRIKREGLIFFLKVNDVFQDTQKTSVTLPASQNNAGIAPVSNPNWSLTTFARRLVGLQN